MTIQIIVLLTLMVGLSLGLLVRAIRGNRWRYGSYLGFIWAFFAAFTLAECGYLRAGNWIIALISFLALREYFSLIDFRLQDRLAVLGAYLSIPFMFHFVTIGWYGMFIVAIPVYAFLTIPLLISLNGKETEGTVFSIGVIDFGLFLFVYCMGHIAYLMSVSAWMAVMLILNVVLCDGIITYMRAGILTGLKKCILHFACTTPLAMALNVLLSSWTGMSIWHAITLGALIPMLVLMGRRVGEYVEADLGISKDALFPGRGQILDDLKSLLFTAPIVFHYIWYFLA